MGCYQRAIALTRVGKLSKGEMRLGSIVELEDSEFGGTAVVIGHLVAGRQKPKVVDDVVIVADDKAIGMSINVKFCKVIGFDPVRAKKFRERFVSKLGSRVID